jgi:hypothetical protein
MRSGAVGLGALLVLAGLVFPGRARACDLATPALHTIDPTQVGVDQTPPQLVEPSVAELHNFDHGFTNDGCGGKCGSDHSARLINLGTDDTTPADRIGYRVTLVAGDAPNLTTSGGRALLGAADGSLTLYWDGDDDFDFTLQLIAVDAAGNESAPRPVRVSDGGGCSVGGRRVSDGFALAVVALALVSAAARSPRRRR